MPVELRTRDDLSVNDIVRLGRTHLVKVTPHVGNWTPARLVLPTLGISILCVDHTIGIKDRNAHPHLLICGGAAHVLCDHADRLTTHSHVTRAVNGGKHPAGKSLAEVHIGTIRSLHPSADIVTHCEHLREHRDITLAVLEEATSVSRSATWWRRVSEDGMVMHYRSKDLPRHWREYAPRIFPLTSAREGWLIHNRISILMDVILQSRMGTESEIYHLSGPDMVRYLGGEIETISALYDHMRRRFGFVQETIAFNLVPFASFRFATRASQAQACERICEGVVISSPSEKLLRMYIVEAPDILAETETKSYFTQHDQLATEEAIVVPEIAREWSMSTCADYLARVKALL